MASNPLAPSRSSPLSRTPTNITTRAGDGHQNGEGNESKPQTTSPAEHFTARGRQRRPTQSHRKIVFSDPVAFRYLEGDAGTIVLDRRRRLQGYETYVVEQWACSRIHPTFIICTYTGDASHSILVNVLAVPNDETTWSRRLQIYFEAVSQSFAREKETQLGTLMVTNLSGFPSALTVIPVPDGDIRKHREDFIVGEDLKRMGCSGRAAMNLQYPQSSTIAKFHHLYRTNESVSLYPSVIELVKLCQTALIMYGKLQAAYADGLLCDITERAINDWWNDIGTDFHNVEPTDGTLGPITVSALVGLLVGAFNRLKAAGAPVGKDPLDVLSMKRAIGHFQKSYKMEKTRRLDRATLDRLHRVTAKTATDEGLKVPRAIKSTVAELSGKGGEMLARGFGGGREKASISEVETLDIGRLSQLIVGAKMKWLWQGKPLKSAHNERVGTLADELNGRVFSTDDQGNFLWIGTQNDGPHEHGGDGHGIVHENDDQRKHGRIRGALKPHAPRHVKPDHENGDTNTEIGASTISRTYSRTASSSHSSLHNNIGQDLSTVDSHGVIKAPWEAFKDISKTPHDLSPLHEVERPSHREALRNLNRTAGRESPGKKRVRKELANLRSEFQSDVYQGFQGINLDTPKAKALRRSQSAIILREVPVRHRRNKLPRQLSFSLVEGTAVSLNQTSEEDKAVAQLKEKAEAESEGSVTALASLTARERDITEAQSMASKLLQIERALIPYTDGRIEHVEGLDGEAREHLDELNNIYYQSLEEYQTQQATSTDLVTRERSGLNESFRRIDMSGQKLDYELSSLHSRMQEVEDGVAEFERNVRAVEKTVEDLISDTSQRRLPWIQRILNLLGGST